MAALIKGSPIPVIKPGDPIEPVAADVEAGEALTFANYTAQQLRNEMMSMLVVRANLSLPPGLRFQIRNAGDEDYGRVKGMAWYRHPAMDGVVNWKGHGGTHVVANFSTPEVQKKAA